MLAEETSKDTLCYGGLRQLVPGRPEAGVFEPVSPLARSITDLFVVVMTLGALVLAGVTGTVVFFGIRYRARPGDDEPAPIYGNRRLEIAWFVIPAVIVAGLLGLSIVTARAADPPTTGTPDLVIIGHQWWWEVVYPQNGAVSANEIHIPTGRPILVQLESIDVIHDFWVPQLGRKMDAIPGVANRFWIQADLPGVYLGACAEYCGTQHAWMRIRVVAQPPAEFEAWLQQEARPIAPPATALARQGQALFESKTCANCHAIDGRAQRPNVGPNLAQLARRETIGGGVIANTPENLARWLANPGSIKPGSLMPDLNLTQQEVAALVAFLDGRP
ncbi:MAG: cytochrome c oxidase subunit II [Dehalococcoidia bacterium]|nr:MAG: cytochrome c oxidase subunit II [Dehalococcoidia bacterium]